MKATIKYASGLTVEVDGTKDEVLEVVRAAMGLSGLGQAPIFIPTVFPFDPNMPYGGATPPVPTPGIQPPYTPYPPNGVPVYGTIISENVTPSSECCDPGMASPMGNNTVTLNTNDFDKGTMTVDLSSFRVGFGG